MILLTEIIKTSPEFLEASTQDREVYARLAYEFEENDLALHLTPVELATKLGVGNKFQWQRFLLLEPVKLYIQQQVNFNAQIASRQALSALAKSAAAGDTQAAKQVNELAGIHNKGDQNKVVVLHRVNRPEVKKPATEENT